MMNFGEVLDKAWKTIWKHKILWLFGFFASCANGGGRSGGGSSGGSSSGSYDRPDINRWRDDQDMMPGAERTFNDLGNTLQHTEPWVFIAALIIFILLMVLLVLLIHAVVTIGRTGLVHGTWQSEEGVEKLHFMEVVRATLPHFWKVFLLYILVGLVSSVLMLVLIIPPVLVLIWLSSLLSDAAILVTIFAVLIIFVGLMMVIVPFSWAVNIFIELMVVAIVAENLGFVDAVKRTWQLVKSKPVSVLLMALMLGMAKFFVSLFIMIPMMLVWMPMIGGVFSMMFTDSDVIWPAIAGGLVSLACCCMCLPVSVLLSSILEAYVKSAWTLTFRQLRGIADVAAE